MISIKNEHELEAMRQACKITAAARALAGEMVRPGVTPKQIDKAVHDFIVQQGARPSFLHYGGFPASACISVNNTVIHGIPGGRVLREGDIVSVDVGASMETVLRLIPVGRSRRKRKGSSTSPVRAFSRACNSQNREIGSLISPMPSKRMWSLTVILWCATS